MIEINIWWMFGLWTFAFTGFGIIIGYVLRGQEYRHSEQKPKEAGG